RTRPRRTGPAGTEGRLPEGSVNRSPCTNWSAWEEAVTPTREGPGQRPHARPGPLCCLEGAAALPPATKWHTQIVHIGQPTKRGPSKCTNLCPVMPAQVSPDDSD